MTDRDFKLLVREYFQWLSKMNHAKDGNEFAFALEMNNRFEKRILSELEAFTEQEQQELPFKD